MDKKQEYEVEQYEDDPKLNFHVSPGMPKPAIPLIGKIGIISLIAAAFVILIALLALQLIVVTSDQSACSCNCPTQAPTDSMALTSNAGPNCTTIYNQRSDDLQNKIMELQTQVNRLANASERNSWKIDDIRSFADSQTETSFNNTRDIDKILETTGNSAQKLINIVQTLSNHRDTSTSTAGVADDILLIAQELLVLHNGTGELPTSCQQIKSQQPNSPSGVYLLGGSDGVSYSTYCNMEELCGLGGGWTRLAYLDMTDASQNCPSEFLLYTASGRRTCGKNSMWGSSCEPKIFSSRGISYTHVCGKAIAYQFGTPDGATNSIHNHNIDAVYMDGLSITHGSPRQHIWSLMIGVHAHKNYPDNCPCAGGLPLPAFVGNDYFCESGNPTDSWAVQFYPNDPLWDGQGCDAAEATCCTEPGLPWFNKTLSASTTDYIEMRICTDEGTSNEDIKLESYEIYIK